MKQATKSRVPVIVKGRGKIEPPVRVEVRVSLSSHEPPAKVNPGSHCVQEGVWESEHWMHFEIASLQFLQILLTLKGVEEGHEERHDPFVSTRGELQVKQFVVLLQVEQLFWHNEQLSPWLF